jgi:hypothetical protein
LTCLHELSQHLCKLALQLILPDTARRRIQIHKLQPTQRGPQRRLPLPRHRRLLSRLRNRRPGEEMSTCPSCWANMASVRSSALCVARCSWLWYASEGSAGGSCAAMTPWTEGRSCFGGGGDLFQHQHSSRPDFPLATHQLIGVSPPVPQYPPSTPGVENLLTPLGLDGLLTFRPSSTPP